MKILMAVTALMLSAHFASAKCSHQSNAGMFANTKVPTKVAQSSSANTGANKAGKR